MCVRLRVHDGAEQDLRLTASLEGEDDGRLMTRRPPRLIEGPRVSGPHRQFHRCRRRTEIGSI